jgi:peptidoglycan/LPS O-acetylase OafA/YrhL
MEKRYEVLDGLRGTASLVVLIFHLLEVIWGEPAKNPLHHAYLAVDFFFMLSGFVVGHAYDARWPRMSLTGFFGRRLLRLHPLVLLGATLGLISYVVDPFAQEAQQAAPTAVFLTFGLLLLCLPSPDLPNRWGETHSLNGPTWTLMQEYLANIAYALVLRRLSVGALAALAAVAGIGLVVAAGLRGDLGAGWGWSTIGYAPIRTAFPFLAGLLLHRSGARLRLPGGWLLLSVVLVAAFAAPTLSMQGVVKPNGVFEALIIIGLFPLVIAAGATAEAGGALGRVSGLLGRISYPLYVTHYPFLYVFSHWTWSRKPPLEHTLAVGAGVGVFCVLFAWAALKFFDEPVRAWLARRERRVAPA